MNLPRISIVTPSFNQGKFLEETLRSVLEQNYPNLDYVVMDGGSNDNSVDIIRKYEGRLFSWVSEKDAGQYDAINRGFAKIDGEVMAWLNSDDKYTPWALSIVGEIFARFPQIEWLTSLFPLHWDAQGRGTWCRQINGYGRRAFYRGEYLPRPRAPASYFIQQESTFWRRSLWDRVGGKIDATLPLAGDFQLWAMFFKHADLYGVQTPLGGFRMHGDQKTGHRMDAYIEEALQVLSRHGGRPYTRAEALFRSRARRYLPNPVKRLLGLTDPFPTCAFAGGGWQTWTRYS